MALYDYNDMFFVIRNTIVLSILYSTVIPAVLVSSFLILPVNKYSLLKIIGSRSGNGQYYNPESIVIDHSGNVYVIDAGNNRVQKFTGNGTFVTKWGTSDNGSGQFNDPRGIDIDSSGNVYATDIGNNRVQVFAPLKQHLPNLQH